MSPILFLLLAILPRFIFSYNIDTRYPIIYRDPDPTNSLNYFGYALALNKKKNSGPAFLFVGAPRTSNGTGKVYRCTETVSGNSECQGLRIDEVSNQKVLFDRYQVSISPGKIGGLGASLAVESSSNLTVCAPYSVYIKEYCVKRRLKVCDNIPLETMHGYCYDVPGALGDILYRDNDFLQSQLMYNSAPHISDIYGFSINYALNKASGQFDRIIGRPRVAEVAIKKGSTYIVTYVHQNETFNTGYAVTSGYYFNHNELTFVAGVPGANRKGKIQVLKAPYYNRPEIEYTASELGEYFGASLATGDFNHDGYDDIAVGAPYWGDVNVGRVYTYYGRKERVFQRGITLQGLVGYGQFGYTLASADLDRDGYSDLIVSAPWEKEGVVYIYYGSRDFEMGNAPVQMGLKIEPSLFMHNNKIKGFGFGLSNPVDIDNNGYPDLAIGAYKSGHAVVLRSKPVIKTRVRLVAYPDILQKTDKSFIISVCLTYEGLNAPHTQVFEINMILDKIFKRIKSGINKNFYESFTRNGVHCTNQTFTLMEEDTNRLDPIKIQVTHTIKEEATSFCSSCPVLSRNGLEKSVQTEVLFNTECANGSICEAELSMSASFADGSQHIVWVAGSGDTSLHVGVTNEGEPAYQTKVEIDMPTGIRLRKDEPSCIEFKNDNSFTLFCDFGNPLYKGKPESIVLNLNMEAFIESDEDTVLIFNITKSTRSNDKRMANKKSLKLTIKNVAYLTLEGLADVESIDYKSTGKISSIPIQHTYQVTKHGKTPINLARLTINIPTTTTARNDSFSRVLDPKLIDGGGKPYPCKFNDDSTEKERTSDPDAGFVQRKRRGASKDDEKSMVLTNSTSSSLGDEQISNGTRKERAMDSLETSDRMMHLNCSNENVTCLQITCDFKFLETSGNIGTIALDIRFNASTFFTSTEESLRVKFNTNASVKIIFPYISGPDSNPNTTAEVATMLYNIPEPSKLSGWVLPSSIILGILLFCILAFVLYKIGFFNRSKKAEIARAKEMEMILKPDEQAENAN